jgi:hypothetical protein
MAAQVASLYNTLPTLGEADERFAQRENVLQAVATLLG